MAIFLMRVGEHCSEGEDGGGAGECKRDAFFLDCCGETVGLLVCPKLSGVASSSTPTCLGFGRYILRRAPKASSSGVAQGSTARQSAGVSSKLTGGKSER